MKIKVIYKNQSVKNKQTNKKETEKYRLFLLNFNHKKEKYYHVYTETVLNDSKKYKEYKQTQREKKKKKRRIQENTYIFGILYFYYMRTHWFGFLLFPVLRMPQTDAQTIIKEYIYITLTQCCSAIVEVMRGGIIMS